MSSAPLPTPALLDLWVLVPLAAAALVAFPLGALLGYSLLNWFRKPPAKDPNTHPPPPS